MNQNKNTTTEGNHTTKDISKNQLKNKTKNANQNNQTIKNPTKKQYQPEAAQ